MQLCSHCDQPIGDDGLALKDGTFLCPECFKVKFPEAPKAKPPWYSSLSAERLAVAALVIGLSGAGYLIYRHNKAESAEAAVAAEEARERSARLEQESAEKRKKYDAEAAAAKAAALKRDAERAAATARAVEEAKIKAAQRIEERELKQREAELDARVRDQDKRDAASRTDRSREDSATNAFAQNEKLSLADQEEIRALRQQAANVQKDIKRAEEERPAKQRNLTTYNTIFEAKKSALEGMQAKYRAVLTETAYFRNTPVWEIEWLPSYFKRTRIVGNTAVSQESEYIPVAAQYNTIASECRARLADVNKLKSEIASLDLTIAEGSSTLSKIGLRLSELRSSGADVAAKVPMQMLDLAPAPNSTRKQGLKTLYKKDGTKIQIQSFITMGKELKYKDESGNWHTLDTADVDKVENGPDPSKPEMVPGSGAGKGKIDI